MLKFVQRPELLKTPKRFEQAVLETVKTKALKDIGEHYIQKFDEYYNLGIAPGFFGVPGIGKTYTAAAIVLELAKSRGVPVFWADTVEMLNRIIDLRDYRSAEFFSLKTNVMKSPLVVLDDFGQLREFPRIQELFFEIVNYRYSEKKPTIFTANIQITALPDNDWISVDLNEPLLRRIKIMTEGLTFASGVNRGK